jgi:hypothetical protein
VKVWPQPARDRSGVVQFGARQSRAWDTHSTKRQDKAEPATANGGVPLPMLSSMKPANFCDHHAARRANGVADVRHHIDHHQWPTSLVGQTGTGPV